MKINYGLIAISENAEILHFCGYEEKPKESDKNNLIEELKTDPEFGLTERNDYIVIEAWKELITKYRNIVGNF